MGDIARHVIRHNLKPVPLTERQAPYDVASNIRQALSFDALRIPVSLATRHSMTWRATSARP